MISVLYQPNPPFDQPVECGPGRTENRKRFFKNGRVYTMVWRDKITIEDPYLVLVKSSAYAIRMSEPYGGNPPKRSFKDYLIKTNLVI
jgi:hypothetical protein